MTPNTRIPASHPAARRRNEKLVRVLCLIAAGSFAAAATLSAARHELVPPAVPTEIEVDADHKPYLMVHAFGAQNQICLPNSTGTALVWTLYGPQATLFKEEGGQVGTHFLSANPEEAGLPRPAWQHRDSSTIWAEAVGISTDPDYVAPDAIAWLKLRIVGDAEGPDGGDRLTETTFIQRVNTVGGKPAEPTCVRLGDKLLVPYEADYVFYRAR